MSFQSFSKLPPPVRNHPKNLPTPEFIATLHFLTENTENRYDARNHILTVTDLSAFSAALREKLNRSLESFGKQLKFLGFKKHKEYLQGDEPEEEKLVIRYYWRGRKEEYIAKELEFAERHLLGMIKKASELRSTLIDRKSNLDLTFEKSIFWGMNRNISNITVQEKISEALTSGKLAINLAHKSSG
jgi:hypothetical protein